MYLFYSVGAVPNEPDIEGWPFMVTLLQNLSFDSRLNRLTLTQNLYNLHTDNIFFCWAARVIFTVTDVKDADCFRHFEDNSEIIILIDVH
jgi:hypothetical protein